MSSHRQYFVFLHCNARHFVLFQLLKELNVYRVENDNVVFGLRRIMFQHRKTYPNASRTTEKRLANNRKTFSLDILDDAKVDLIANAPLL